MCLKRLITVPFERSELFHLLRLNGRVSVIPTTNFMIYTSSLFNIINHVQLVCAFILSVFVIYLIITISRTSSQQVYICCSCSRTARNYIGYIIRHIHLLAMVYILHIFLDLYSSSHLLCSLVDTHTYSYHWYWYRLHVWNTHVPPPHIHQCLEPHACKCIVGRDEKMLYNKCILN